MEEAPPPAPAPEAPIPSTPPPPKLRGFTKFLLATAVLMSAAAAGGCFLPWFKIVWLGDEEIRIGFTSYVEGIVEASVGALAAVLFLATLLTATPRTRGRLAVAAACLAFASAVVPFELVFREAWMGQKTVVVIGEGYVGWSYGLYLSLAAGFAAAAAGSVAANTVARPPAAVPVKLRSVRKTPRA